MTRKKQIVCIVCPNSCSLDVFFSSSKIIKVDNALCPKGFEYANLEIFNPLRILTTTVKVENGILPLVSVRSDIPIDRKLLKRGIAQLNRIVLSAPVAFHQVVQENFLGTAAKIITTRAVSVKR